MTASELIAQERKRQVAQEGYTAAHDAQHTADELAAAASSYFGATGPEAATPGNWPWGPQWWKPKARSRNLIRAGALYLAAADRAADHETKEVMRGFATACAKALDALPA